MVSATGDEHALTSEGKVAPEQNQYRPNHDYGPPPRAALNVLVGRGDRPEEYPEPSGPGIDGSQERVVRESRLDNANEGLLHVRGLQRIGEDGNDQKGRVRDAGSRCSEFQWIKQ